MAAELRSVEWKRVGKRVLVRCPHCTVMDEWTLTAHPSDPPDTHDFQCGSCKHTEKVRLERKRG
jgi:hypothetical protein